MARLVVMKGHQKDTWYDEIGLCAQVLDIIQGSIVSPIKRAYVTKLYPHFDLL